MNFLNNTEMSGYIYRVFGYFSKLFAKEEKNKKNASKHCTPPWFMPSNVIHSIRKFNSDSNLAPASRLKIRNPHQTPMRRFVTYNPCIPREFSRDFNTGSQAHVRNGENFLDTYTIPPYKGSEPSSDMATNSFPECGNCGNFVTNQGHTHLRNDPVSHLDCSFKAIACKKVPPHNQGRSHSEKPGRTAKRIPQHRGLHTLRRKSEEVIDCKGKEQAADGDCLKSLDIGNWLVYRNDTVMQFEHVFKHMAKMRHTNGNIMDAKTHAFWMVQSGITVDKDGSMFKRFAGGKVVLTIGEYKFLIHKLCCIHELDYWDTLRKMATFQV